MGADYVDIYHLHGVPARDYEYARDVLLPTLIKLRDDGTIRAVGITEAFVTDPSHQMLRSAVADGCWDVMMVGFNILNQSARSVVLEPARAARIGILGMFAVRRALSDGGRLAETITALAHDGHVAGDCPSSPSEDAVGLLIGDSGAHSITELAYRFALHEPGVTNVLFGTGNPEHVTMNIDSVLKPPLSESTTTRLRHLRIVDGWERPHIYTVPAASADRQ